MLRSPRLASVIVTLGCLYAPTRADDKVVEPLRVAGDRPADIRHIKIEASVDIPKKYFGGTATIDLVALRELKSIKFDAVDFDVTKVLFARGEGQAAPVEYINDGESIEILIGDQSLTSGTPATVTIEYSTTELN